MSEAFREFAALRAEPINLESAKKVVAANDKLMEACKAYSQARRGAVSSSGRERLAVIDSLFSYQDSLNIDQMRDARKNPGGYGAGEDREGGAKGAPQKRPQSDHWKKVGKAGGSRIGRRKKETAGDREMIAKNQLAEE